MLTKVHKVVRLAREIERQEVTTENRYLLRLVQLQKHLATVFHFVRKACQNCYVCLVAFTINLGVTDFMHCRGVCAKSSRRSLYNLK